MQKFLEKITKFENQLKLIWVVIVVSPIFVSILVSINLFNIPTSNDWIGFYASIFGGIISGLLTFFNMYLSIDSIRKQISEQKRANELLECQLNNEKSKVKDSERLSVRPYINEYVGDANHVIEHFSVIFEKFSFENKYEDKISLKIKNIGLGPVIEFKVNSLNSCDCYHSDVKSLEKDGVMKLDVSYTFNEMYLMMTYYLDISYCDILDNKYSQMINIISHRDNYGKPVKTIISEISKPKLIEKIS